MSDMDPLWLMVDGVAGQVDGGDDAEKLAALEVVKRRLKAAGLGVLTLVCIRSDRPICNRSTVSAKLISLCNQSQQKLFTFSPKKVIAFTQKRKSSFLKM